MQKAPPLRRFSVKKGVPYIPKDAVLSRPPREKFPYAIDSDEGKKLLAETEPAELRHRFGCWINDAKTDRHAIFYYMAPDADGHVALRSVPAARLREFFDDVSHDWDSFESTHAPPCDADGDPLFDPRFVSYARKLPTNGDFALMKKYVEVEAGNPESTTEKEDVMPTLEPLVKAAVADGSTLGKVSGRQDVEMEEGPKAGTPTKPKAKASAKPKAKTPAKPKPKADGGSDFVFDTDAVYVKEAEDFRASQAFNMVRLWNGDVPVNGIIPGSGMDPIVARTGKIVAIGEAKLLCQHGAILRNHRGGTKSELDLEYAEP